MELAAYQNIYKESNPGDIETIEGISGVCIRPTQP